MAFTFNLKIKAARAALGWTRDDLSSACGISTPAIIKIENGDTSPTMKTQRQIVQALENEGFFFTANGIEYREDKVRRLYDFLDVLEDAERCLKPDDEILLHCASEKRNSEVVTEKFQSLLKSGIKLRFTLEEGDDAITTRPENYRWLDPDFFANSQVSVIYADKCVEHVKEDDKDVFIMVKNEAMADSRRKQFEYYWRNGKCLPETEKDT